MISKLETNSISERNRELVRSDYNKDNQYSRQHPDSQSDGDVKGRGYGSGAGHTNWMPNNNNPQQPNVFSFRNFDTDPSMNIGTANHPRGLDDNNARRQAFARQLYNAQNQYPLGGSIDTSANVLEGQVVVNM